MNTHQYVIHKKKLSWFLRVSLAGLLTCASMVSAAEFEYSSDLGPGFWGEIPGFEVCAGISPDARQSPIDISEVRTDSSLSALDLNLLETEIALINNGHTIEQEYHNGSTLTIDGVVYQLLQFHFHTLSEHAVEGKRGLMELHAVFSDGSTGNLAVVSVLYKPGDDNSFLNDLIAAGLPEKTDDTVNSTSMINLANALTDTSSYYTYPGSLTTPPCSEIVTWIVLKEPATISESQRDAFRRILGNDFRPLQKLNDRTIRVTASGKDNH